MLFDHTYTDTNDNIIHIGNAYLLKNSHGFYDADFYNEKDYAKIVHMVDKDKVPSPANHMLLSGNATAYRSGLFITQAHDEKGKIIPSTFKVFSVEYASTFTCKQVCTLKENEKRECLHIEAISGEQTFGHLKTNIEKLLKNDAKSILKPEYQPAHNAEVLSSPSPSR